jgi:hypothetical protein
MFRHAILTVQSSVSHSWCSTSKISASRLRFLQYACLREFSSGGPTRRPRKKLWLYGLTGIVGGAVAGGGYTYYQLQQARIPISNEGTGTTSLVLPSKPITAVSKKV